MRGEFFTCEHEHLTSFDHGSCNIKEGGSSEMLFVAGDAIQRDKSAVSAALTLELYRETNDRSPDSLPEEPEQLPYWTRRFSSMARIRTALA